MINILKEPMKLSEALQLVNASSDSSSKLFHLVCGFTPLHLATFLRAHVQRRLTNTPVQLGTGLYGDFYGNLTRVPDTSQGAAIVLEWFDLDPRLGSRGSGRWDIADVASNVSMALARIDLLLTELEQRCSVTVLCGPTLRMLPVFHTGNGEAGEVELALEAALAAFLADVASRGRTRIVNRAAVDAASPAAERYNGKLHLEVDFPYQRVHAGVVADHIADLLVPAPALKGIITDLDDTLWFGILGEAGVDGVSWNLAQHSHVHALYQQMLSSLADAGILVAVCTKNDPALVAKAFERADMILRFDQVYPVAAGWGPKSESIGRILSTWNIGAGDVAFVDDSPLELEEVARTHSGIQCMRFPSAPGEADKFIRNLRDRFGRSVIRQEDKLRASSIRTNELFFTSAGATADSFLQSTNPSVVLDFTLNPDDERALELVNKTNQFNINGVRYPAGEWKQLLSRPGAFLMTTSYEDKFGPLGKIAVMSGTLLNADALVDVWVMSCRAFSRRIEHQCLRAVFELDDRVSQVTLSFRPTDRNGPVQDFLREFSPADTNGKIARDTFFQNCPVLPHSVNVIRSAYSHG